MTILFYFIIAGFIGTPPGVTAPPLTDTNYVVTNLTCNNNLECTNTTGSSGCGSHGGGYAAITCGRCMYQSVYQFIIYYLLIHQHMYLF